MKSILAFHAHPDDEVMGTGVTLAKYSDEGVRTVVVTATDGSEGEIRNYDNPEEIKPKLAEVRKKELEASLESLGVSDYEWMGYKDSGMMGDDSNKDPECFWQQDYFGPVGRLVHIIRKYQPEAIITYDPFGGYGHPDHIQANRIGTAAFFAMGDLDKFPLNPNEEFWIPERLYFTSWSKARIQARREQMYKVGLISKDELDKYKNIGNSDEDIDVEVDGKQYVQKKIDAWKCHRTQLGDDWWAFNIPEEYRDDFLGVESYITAFNRGRFNSKTQLL